MYSKKANLHIHSIYSDGIHLPWVIIQTAKLLGVEILSITDHNEITGTLKGLKYAKKAKMIYFPGIELTFSIGGKVYEILAYFKDGPSIKNFYREYRYGNGYVPHFRKIEEVTSLIKKHNGLTVVPHPFGRKGIFRKLRHRGLKVNAVEIVNAFTGEKRNKKARRHEDFGEDYIKLGAADMHFFIRDLHKVYTEIDSKNEITTDNLWDALNGKNNGIRFLPRGNSFSARKIMIQKPMCGVVYAVNYLRLYPIYRIRKERYRRQKRHEKIPTEKPVRHHRSEYKKA